MKIYFAGSIRGGRKDADLYLQIIDHLRQYGEVLTEHIGHNELNVKGEAGMTDRDIHDRDMEWLLSAEIVVAEVTTPSLGVGYEIGRALENGKRIICLFRQQDGRRLSAMISGSKRLTSIKYSTIDDARRIIDVYFG